MDVTSSFEEAGIAELSVERDIVVVTPCTGWFITWDPKYSVTWTSFSKNVPWSPSQLLVRDNDTTKGFFFLCLVRTMVFIRVWVSGLVSNDSNHSNSTIIDHGQITWNLKKLEGQNIELGFRKQLGGQLVTVLVTCSFESSVINVLLTITVRVSIASLLTCE